MRNVGTEGGQIAAHVAHQVDIHAEKFSVSRKCHFRRRHVVAALTVAEEMIRTIRNPLHSLLQLARGKGRQRILAVRK